MPEPYFLKLRSDSSKEDFARISSFLLMEKGKILLASPEKHWVLAVLEKKTAESLKGMRKVELVGGVTLRRREIKVIRRTKTPD
ncbi:MAG: hypothetical protein HXY45_13945 [Syntrophaceae bacterium]|nr:hypothetical protein [Syntrophaceae bacterium]